MPMDIYFRKDKDYRTAPVSGVWGGVAPHGLIFADFFLEKPDSPEKITVDDAGKEASRQPAGMFVVRDTLFGILVRPEIARAIGQWFIDKADEYEKQVREKK